MACGYWDEYTGSTTGDLGGSWAFDTSATSATVTTTYITWTTSSSPTTWSPRRILVKIPASWDKQKIAAYARLVNRETNTGWKVEFVIEGDVAIVDPNIEIREMAEFVPLLKHCASEEDRRKIDEFFQLE